MVTTFTLLLLPVDSFSGPRWNYECTAFLAADKVIALLSGNRLAKWKQNYPHLSNKVICTL